MSKLLDQCFNEWGPCEDYNNAMAEITRLCAALAEAERARDEYLLMARLHGDGLVEVQARLAAAETKHRKDLTELAHAHLADLDTRDAKLAETERKLANLATSLVVRAELDKLALDEIALATRDAAFEAETVRAERAEAQSCHEETAEKLNGYILALAEAERERDRALEKWRIGGAMVERAEAELAASLVVRAELEHRLASRSDDKLRAENLKAHEQQKRVHSAAWEAGYMEAIEHAAALHESVNPASDEERLRSAPGAGAMGAVIQYRDLIRQRTPPQEADR